MSRRHFEQLTSLLAAMPDEQDIAEALVSFFRDAARGALAAAWREVMVAARTDEALRDAVEPAVKQFENTIFEVAAHLPGAPGDSRAFGTLLLSMLHMYDSEATTIRIVETPDIERARFDWAVALLREQLRRRC
jgi:hypothetical protein